MSWCQLQMDEDAREMFFQSPRGDRYNTLREELKKDRSLYIRSSQSTCTTFASMKLDVEAPCPCRAHIITDGSNDLRNELVALIFMDLLDRAGPDLLKIVATNAPVQLRVLDKLFSREASKTQKHVKRCGDWTGEGETTMAGVILFARQFAVYFQVGSNSHGVWLNQCAEGYGNVEVFPGNDDSFGGSVEPTAVVQLIALGTHPFPFPASLFLCSKKSNVVNKAKRINIPGDPKENLDALQLQRDETVLACRVVKNPFAPPTNWKRKPTTQEATQPPKKRLRLMPKPEAVASCI